jgi:hypothetical protein
MSDEPADAVAGNAKRAAAVARRVWTVEEVTAIRDKYARGVPIKQIRAEHNLSLEMLYYWVSGGRADGPLSFPPLPLRRGGRDRIGQRRPILGDRDRLIRRMWRTAGAQVREIETRLLASGQAPDERERDARVLAVLARTLRELASMSGEITKPTGKRKRDDDHDRMPRNIEDLRRALARKIDAVIARRDPATADDPRSD